MLARNGPSSESRRRKNVEPLTRRGCKLIVLQSVGPGISQSTTASARGTSCTIERLGGRQNFWYLGKVTSHTTLGSKCTCDTILRRKRRAGTKPEA